MNDRVSNADRVERRGTHKTYGRPAVCNGGETQIAVRRGAANNTNLEHVPVLFINHQTSNHKLRVKGQGSKRTLRVPKIPDQLGNGLGVGQRFKSLRDVACQGIIAIEPNARDLTHRKRAIRENCIKPVRRARVSHSTGSHQTNVRVRRKTKTYPSSTLDDPAMRVFHGSLARVGACSSTLRDTRPQEGPSSIDLEGNFQKLLGSSLRPSRGPERLTWSRNKP